MAKVTWQPDEKGHFHLVKYKGPKDLVVDDYIQKEKCARCKQLKTFLCEHDTIYRKEMSLKTSSQPYDNTDNSNNNNMTPRRADNSMFQSRSTNNNNTNRQQARVVANTWTTSSSAPREQGTFYRRHSDDEYNKRTTSERAQVKDNGGKVIYQIGKTGEYNHSTNTNEHRTFGPGSKKRNSEVIAANKNNRSKQSNTCIII